MRWLICVASCWCLYMYIWYLAFFEFVPNTSAWVLTPTVFLFFLYWVQVMCHIHFDWIAKLTVFCLSPVTSSVATSWDSAITNTDVDVDVLLVTWLYLHVDNAYRLGIVLYSKLNKRTSHWKCHYVTSDNRAFTKDLYSDGCLHDNIGENLRSQTLKKLGPTGWNCLTPCTK